MKYMVKWSFEAENLDKVIELFQKSLKRSAKDKSFFSVQSYIIMNLVFTEFDVLLVIFSLKLRRAFAFISSI